MSRRNTEAVILDYFNLEPYDKAELMLKLAKNVMKGRKVVHDTLKPIRMAEEKEKAGVQKAG